MLLLVLLHCLTTEHPRSMFVFIQRRNPGISPENSKHAT